MECWLIGDGSGKAYLAPTVENSPTFREGTPEYRSLNSVNELHKVDSDLIFSLHPKIKYPDLVTQRKFITLQHGIDSFIETTPDELASSDLLCFYSPFWLDWAARLYEAKGLATYSGALAVLKPKVFFSGFPQMDALSGVDAQEVRRRHGIDPERPVVLLLPITLANKGGSWPRFFEAPTRKKQLSVLLRAARSNWRFVLAYALWLLAGINDLRLSRAIREFCDRNGAVLIAKGRLKDQLRPWLEDLADISLYDERVFPPTILELLSIADVCIHFYSFAALESAFVGTFGINIDRPSPAVDFGETPPVHHRLWRRAETGSAFNAPGVNLWMTIPEAIRKLPGMRLDQLRSDSQKRESYIERYLGFSDRESSHRVLDYVSEGIY